MKVTDEQPAVYAKDRVHMHPLRGRPRKRTATLFLRALNADVKAHFKAACAKMGESMQTAVERLMREYIKDSMTVKHQTPERNLKAKRAAAQQPQPGKGSSDGNAVHGNPGRV